jgi:response regulator RpfG family c-di-GMP phosphodiesterase
MAKEITKNKNYGKKIKHLHKEDEISTLYKSFNSLLDSVKTSLNTEKKLNEEIEKTQKEIIFTMATVAEGRSKETGNHVKRVAEYSTLLAKYYGLSKETCELIRMASPMHDIGKIAIPDNILKKPGLLTDEERIIMNKHAEYGFNMLKHSDRPLIKMASIIALEHHEKYNGTGYPKGLEGEQINIEARITAIADVFDALGSDRVYKKAWEDEKIFNLFKNERGKHFDPKLIDLFFENIDEFLSIRESLKDDVNEKNIYDLA